MILYLWFSSGAAGVEDKQRIFRVTPLGFTLIRHPSNQGVPAQIHLRVPRDLRVHKTQTGNIKSPDFSNSPFTHGKTNVSSIYNTNRSERMLVTHMPGEILARRECTHRK